MTRSSGESDAISMLRRLGQDVEVPSADPEAERRLLVAFDTAWERKRVRTLARARLWRPVAAAALIGLAATVAWTITSRSGRLSRRAPSRPLVTTDFVLWPGAAELPAFESGHLLRMEMPASALPSLGLVAPSAQATVQTDVLVGQDGLPRAVRLSPDF